MKVICDTNIWYAIADGDIDLNSLPQEIQLCASWVNLIELSMTPNLLSDLCWMQNVITSFYNAKPTIYETNPIEYIIKYQHADYELRDKEYEEIIDSFEKIIEMDASIPVDEELNKRAEEEITRKEADLQKSADAFNEQLPDIRDKIKATVGKKVHREKYSLPGLFGMINFFVKDWTMGNYELDPKTYPLEKIELFLSVWDDYFTQLEVSLNALFKPNDFYDIFNLVYVDQETKYWTLDKKGPNSILREEKYSDFIFSLD